MADFFLLFVAVLGLVLVDALAVVLFWVLAGELPWFVFACVELVCAELVCAELACADAFVCDALDGGASAVAGDVGLFGCPDACWVFALGLAGVDVVVGMGTAIAGGVCCDISCDKIWPNPLVPFIWLLTDGAG